MRSLFLLSLVACSTPQHYRVTTTTTVYRTAIKPLAVSKATKHKHKSATYQNMAPICRRMLNEGKL